MQAQLASLSFLSSPSPARKPTPSEERRRVAAHIHRAETAARAADTTALDPLRRIVRGLLLRELARYRRRGVFPKNRDFAEQTPYFVDAEGTRCAMAHLLEVGGEGELVARVARERNNAWVRELADEPRLLAWLAAAGLTVAEAAAIQPSYCEANSGCICGGTFSYTGYPVPATGVLEGHVTAVNSGSYTVTVTIDQIHGEGGGWQVGDSFTASSGAAVGTVVLAPVSSTADAGTAGDGGTAHALGVVELDAMGNHACSASGTSSRVVSRDLFVEAVTSSDCRATLAAADSSWSRSTCGGGCSAAGSDAIAGAPTTLGILLAIVSAMVARKRRSGSDR